jgi:outer membrane protein OmpA-like peptidoglycan-associated protein
MRATMKYAVPVALAVSLASCATTPNDPNAQAKEKAAIGAALGAVAGAVIGYQGDHSGGALRGALVGAAAGGVVGAGVGHYMDQQQAEFEQKLATERQAHEVEIQRLQDQSLKITMSSEVSFDFNSARVNPPFAKTLDKVADILKRYDRSNIKIVGHTDNVGSEDYNMKLSEQRAQAVAYYLEDQGVSSNRITTEGRGELDPRADNATAAGRQLNRRVEMLIQPDQNIQ